MTLDTKTRERLSAYLDGALSGDERSAAEDLLARDGEARKFLEDLKALQDGLKGLPALAPPEAFYHRVLRDIASPPAPARRSFFASFTMRTAGALAAVTLVAVATRDLWRPEARRRALEQARPSPDLLQTQLNAQPEEAFLDEREAIPPAGRGDGPPAPEPKKAAHAAADAPAETAPSPEPPQPLREPELSDAAAEAKSEIPALIGQSPASARGTPSAAPALAQARAKREEILPEWSGTASGVDRPLTAAVRGDAEWKTLWARHASSPAPAVDFRRHMVLAVFAGTKPTGGHEIRIISVRREAGALLVIYRETAPAPDAFASQVLTQPFHIRLLPRADLPVRFRKASE